jgi:hypothetical protein
MHQSPEYSNVWDITRRLVKIPTIERDQQALGLDPQILIDEWVDVDKTYLILRLQNGGTGKICLLQILMISGSQIKEWRVQIEIFWQNNLHGQNDAVFWHNHFVTEVEDYAAPSWLGFITFIAPTPYNLKILQKL